MSPHSADEHRRAYFYLSYGRLGDVTASEVAALVEHDHWVKSFFVDLSAAVKELVRSESGFDIGHIYPPITFGVQTQASILGALGGAEVFVPLYSPHYVTRPWPQYEKDTFLQRLQSASPEVARDHVQPVLWTPCIGHMMSPDDEENLERAKAFGDDVPVYLENGLGQMCRIKTFQRDYPMLVHRLAERIVGAVQARPLGSSSSLSLATDGKRSPTEVPFVVAVLAPTRQELPRRRMDAYGARPSDWRLAVPNSGRRVADYVTDVAQRLGFNTEVVDHDRAAADLAGCPGLVLVDPWLSQLPGGADEIERALRELPTWASVVIFYESDDPQHGEVEATRADQFANRRVSGSRTRIYPARGISELKQLLRELIPRIRRRYLAQINLAPPQEEEEK